MPLRLRSAMLLLRAPFLSCSRCGAAASVWTTAAAETVLGLTVVCCGVGCADLLWRNAPAGGARRRPCARCGTKVLPCTEHPLEGGHRMLACSGECSQALCDAASEACRSLLDCGFHPRLVERAERFLVEGPGRPVIGEAAVSPE